MIGFFWYVGAKPFHFCVLNNDPISFSCCCPWLCVIASSPWLPNVTDDTRPDPELSSKSDFPLAVIIGAGAGLLFLVILVIVVWRRKRGVKKPRSESAVQLRASSTVSGMLRFKEKRKKKFGRLYSFVFRLSSLSSPSVGYSDLMTIFVNLRPGKNACNIPTFIQGRILPSPAHQHITPRPQHTHTHTHTHAAQTLDWLECSRVITAVTDVLWKKYYWKMTSSSTSDYRLWSQKHIWHYCQ